MSGFAALVALNSPIEALESDFLNLLQLTAKYKQLEIPATTAWGKNCMAVKLDSPATTHHGIVRDDQTGSWLLATGTVVALEGGVNPNTVLIRLLDDYVDNGVKALAAYDGHFALVIYNGREESLSVISDPIGMFSIFYCQQGSQIFVSSSVFAVATITQSQPDVLAMEHFLRTGRLDSTKTLWNNVRRLTAGTVLHVAHGRVEQTGYWSPVYDVSTSRLSFKEALDKYVGLITPMLSRISLREEKTWVDLTGGFDTRLVAMFVEKINVPFCMYSTGPSDHPDVQISRKISRALGWDYQLSQLPEHWEGDQVAWFGSALGCGDGLASTLRFAFVLRGFAERNTTIKTNLMGVGGENLRGYYWQIEKGDIGRTSRVNIDALLDNIFSARFPIHVMRYDRSGDVRQEMSEFVKQLFSQYSEFPNTVKLDWLGIGRDAGHGGAYLSAAASVGRSLAPLCFKEPINFAFSLNYHWKLPRHHVFIRALLERENKLLSEFPTTTGGPAVPIRITNIHRFWPLWKTMLNRAVAITSNRLVGKSVQIWPEPQHLDYPLPSWRLAFHTFARSEGMLTHDTMRTRGLYRRDEFNKFVEQGAQNQQHSSEFIDRVISVEMAMRAVGSSVE